MCILQTLVVLFSCQDLLVSSAVLDSSTGICIAVGLVVTTQSRYKYLVSIVVVDKQQVHS